MGRALNLSQFQHNVTDGTTTVGTNYVVNGSAKAWVAYDQGVNAIKSSFGISSQVDDATGRTTSNFTSSFSSVDNYCVVGSIFDGSWANDTRIFNHDVNNDTYTASAVKYYCWDGSGLNDAHRFFVSFLGDLA